MFGNIKGLEISTVIGALSIFSAGYLKMNQNNSVETSTKPSTNPQSTQSTEKTTSRRSRLNVDAHHYVNDTTYLVRSGDSFYLDGYMTNDETPIVIEDNEGNFSVTTAGEFDELKDVFLTECRSGYHPEGKYIDGFIVQPLGEGRHFDINNHELCGDPAIIQAIEEFKKTKKTQQNSTNITNNRTTPDPFKYSKNIQKDRPRINVTARRYNNGITELVREGDSFYVGGYKTNNKTPIVIEDDKGNFSITTAGEFNGLEDAFLTECRSGYHPEGKYIDGFIVQPLGEEGRHFDINNHELCGDPAIIQAIAEFKKTRQNNTNT